MQLYLDTFGASLGVKDGMFRVRLRDGSNRSFAVRDVRAIFLGKGINVSTNAMRLAIEQGIPMLLTDGIGRPLGQVWSGQFGSISTIRKQQALFALRPEGLHYVAGLLQQRAMAQGQQVRAWAEQGYRMPPDWERALSVIENMAGRHRQAYKYKDREALQQSLRGWEGTATRHYLQVVSAILPAAYAFEGRSKRPAYDPFNALLNYLYGMLYPVVELALMKAGLDPYTGILHADEYNRPTLVYDMIEPYRHWAEHVAVGLCLSGDLPQGTFRDLGRQGFWLGKPGKDRVIGTFLRYLEEAAPHRAGGNRRRGLHPDLDALLLAGKLKESRFDIL